MLTAILHRHAKAAMERKFSFTWQLLGALRTPTLTPRPAEREANSLLLKAKMRRGGAASREALPLWPSLQQLRKVEEEEHVEEREDKEAEDGSEDGCGPLLGALLID